MGGGSGVASPPYPYGMQPSSYAGSDPSSFAAPFGNRHGGAHLSPLSLPAPGSLDPLPQLDRRPAAPPSHPDSSVTLAPLHWTPDASTSRRSGRTSDSVTPYWSQSSAANFVPDSTHPPPRSQSTRPSLTTAHTGLPRPFSPAPNSSRSSLAGMQNPLGSPPRSRTPGPGTGAGGSGASRSRGVLSVEELAAYGYTPAQAAYVANSATRSHTRERQSDYARDRQYDYERARSPPPPPPRY